MWVPYKQHFIVIYCSFLCVLQLKAEFARIMQKEGLISEIKASLRDIFPKIFQYGAKTGRRAILSLTSQVDNEDESNPGQSDRFFNNLL